MTGRDISVSTSPALNRSALNRRFIHTFNRPPPLHLDHPESHDVRMSELTTRLHDGMLYFCM